MEVNLGYFFAMDKDFLLKVQSKRSIDLKITAVIV